MIISDFHVHFHQCYNKELFFNSLRRNFEKKCENENFVACKNIICLTESTGASFFRKLSFFVRSYSKIKSWSFKDTKNKNTIIAKHDSGFEVFIIGGRQIVTKEYLEVLAIGMVDDFQDGTPIEMLIQKIIADGFIPIIPWGFGKWIGKRGEIIAKIVEQNKYHPLFLGDNGNRPSFIKLPSIFQQAKHNSIYNLQGSDPLPFRNEEYKPGSFGIVIDAELDENFPYDSFLKIIKDEESKFINYGKPESPFNFFKHQLGMQVVKRLRK